MAAEKSDIVEREIYIQARAETIFAFFIDPQKLIRWKGLQATRRAAEEGACSRRRRCGARG